MRVTAKSINTFARNEQGRSLYEQKLQDLIADSEVEAVWLWITHGRGLSTPVEGGSNV